VPIHLGFDLAAAALALIVTALVYRWRLKEAPHLPFQTGEGYFAALSAGLLVGSYGLGTANLWLSGLPGIGRSILGALAGAILAVELYKASRGIKGSTGLLFVPAFATLVVVGRIGCALSGIEDNTYGTPTTLPWGHDFGDHILRHPVAAYESLTMAVFLAAALLALARRTPLFMAKGFHLMVASYAVQRFAWEFLKPYGSLLGPFNLFHLTALGLLVYALWMIRKPIPQGT
jgi:phosphatidylglycerol---prolipoprotein diacylglyceryl transferase